MHSQLEEASLTTAGCRTCPVGPAMSELENWLELRPQAVARSSSPLNPRCLCVHAGILLYTVIPSVPLSV